MNGNAYGNAQKYMLTRSKKLLKNFHCSKTHQHQSQVTKIIFPSGKQYKPVKISKVSEIISTRQYQETVRNRTCILPTFKLPKDLRRNEAPKFGTEPIQSVPAI